MTNYEYIKAMSQEELINFLEKVCFSDANLWGEWFENKYCKNCPPIIVNTEIPHAKMKCGWCEIYGFCNFFTGGRLPNNKDVLKRWLEQEKEEGAFDV